MMNATTRIDLEYALVQLGFARQRAAGSIVGGELSIRLATDAISRAMDALQRIVDSESDSDVVAADVAPASYPHHLRERFACDHVG
jgi:hypothetical protein